MICTPHAKVTTNTRDLTLNSSSVKLTRPTPHQGSILKSTGCDGKSSLAIDLFSFHIIFWMNVKGFRIKILVFECASEIVMTLSSSNYWDKTDHEIWLDADLSSRGPSFQLTFQESFRLLTKCWFYICWIAYDPVGAFLEYLRDQDELVTWHNIGARFRRDLGFGSSHPNLFNLNYLYVCLSVWGLL